MRMALRLARRARGLTSPNPMVGAVLVRNTEIIGQGWHHRAGAPHAEIEALRDAARRGHEVRGSTLYVTLEPCCTYGRTPPCTTALIEAGLDSVIVGATDPNPRHAGKAFRILRGAGLRVVTGVLAAECTALNQAFNHWIVHQMPFVTVKAAMTLDGKIATTTGESKWITAERTRRFAMKLRRDADAILVGVNTVIADNPSLTWRTRRAAGPKILQRVILDSGARTPPSAKIVTDELASATTLFVSERAPKRRLENLVRGGARVIAAPCARAIEQPGGSGELQLDLSWILRRLGSERVTHLLVEGGGRVNASFLVEKLANRIVFFYAPKVFGGRSARAAVAGNGLPEVEQALRLRDLHWRRAGPDLCLEASLEDARPAGRTHP